MKGVMSTQLKHIVLLTKDNCLTTCITFTVHLYVALLTCFLLYFPLASHGYATMHRSTTCMCMCMFVSVCVYMCCLCTDCMAWVW